MRQLRPGLQVHADDVRDLADVNAQGEMDEALRIVLLLEGAVDVSYGDRRVQLSSAGAARPVAQALVVSVAERDVFTRRVRRGNYARRVSVGLTQEWLAHAGVTEAGRPLQEFLRSHLSMERWCASPRAVALAEQMVRPPAVDPLLQNIYLEARALELVAEALGRVAGSAAAAPAPAQLRPKEHRRLLELHPVHRYAS